MSVWSALLAASLSAQDANAAVMYVQSYATPAMFDVCKTALPDQAAAYDATMDAWQQRHREAVARGEEVLRQRTTAEGTDMAAEMTAQRDALVAELNSSTPKALHESCEHMLKVVRSEL